jgi:tetratricopeptide (TPR) repeat protein
MMKKVVGKKCRDMQFTSCDVVVSAATEQCQQCGGAMEIVKAVDKKLIAGLGLIFVLAFCFSGYVAIKIVSIFSVPSASRQSNPDVSQKVSTPAEADQERIKNLLQEIYKDGVKSAQEQSKINDLTANQLADPQWLAQQERQIQGISGQAASFSKRGLLYAAQGHYAQAVEEFQHSLKLNDNNALVWANLAAAYIKTNALQAAQSACERAIALDSRNWLAHYNLGALYAGKGNKDAAVFELSEALRFINEDQAQQILKGQVTEQLRADNSFDSLRADPRFRELLARNQ